MAGRLGLHLRTAKGPGNASPGQRLGNHLTARNGLPARGNQLDHGFVMRALLLAMTACLALMGCEKPAADQRTMPRDNQWVETFFQDYAEAFRSKSRARLLAKFSLPLTFLTKTGPIVFHDEEHLSANLEALIRRYEQIQAVDWKHTVKDVRTIGSGIYLVEIEWRFFDAGNELLYACDTSYFLAGDAKPEAKVMAVIAHNEIERYEQAKRKRGF